MEILNIGSRSDDPRTNLLSNFSASSFILDGEYLASVEGFIQGIKYPMDHPNRVAAFKSTGFKAKRFGNKFELFSALRHHGGCHKNIWWANRSIKFRSPTHNLLIKRAIRAKFEQNSNALQALLATVGMTLTHELNRQESPNTSLPADIFCKILTEIRDKNLKTHF